MKQRCVIIETKAKVILTFVSSVTICRCESWTVRKAGRKKIDSLEESSTDNLDYQKDQVALVQIKPETSLEAKTTKLKLSYLWREVAGGGGASEWVAPGWPRWVPLGAP